MSPVLHYPYIILIIYRSRGRRIVTAYSYSVFTASLNCYYCTRCSRCYSTTILWELQPPPFPTTQACKAYSERSQFLHSKVSCIARNSNLHSSENVLNLAEYYLLPIMKNPIVYFNSFCITKHHLIQLNEENKVLRSFQFCHCRISKINLPSPFYVNILSALARYLQIKKSFSILIF